MNKKELESIKVVARWGRNGRKYVWQHPSYAKIEELAERYGIDQICNDCLWLQC